MAKSSDERRAAALRANLKRRKAPKPPAHPTPDPTPARDPAPAQAEPAQNASRRPAPA